jgi:hypothetical protein
MTLYELVESRDVIRRCIETIERSGANITNPSNVVVRKAVANALEIEGALSPEHTEIAKRILRQLDREPVSPYAHELDTHGIDCEADCPACRYLDKVLTKVAADSK